MRAYTRSLYIHTCRCVLKGLFHSERGFFRKTPQNTPKNHKKLNPLFSSIYEKSAFFLHFFCNKIWSVQKFVVPLHPLSLKNGARPKRAQEMIFEKMSIHNKIVVQEQKLKI